MLSSHLVTKAVKWLRNSLEAAVEVGVKGNEVNLSNGSLLTARRNNSLSTTEGQSILLCLEDKLLHQEYLLLYQPHQYACT